ncbi:MAG: hypothetical protein HW398_1087, partial [Acidobacteria bacterium]|nr:hypothetical protein [Acidobacteriota bacterium]
MEEISGLAPGSNGDRDETIFWIEQPHKVLLAGNLEIASVRSLHDLLRRERYSRQLRQQASQRDHRGFPATDFLLERGQRERGRLCELPHGGPSQLGQVRADAKPLSEFVGQRPDVG